MEKDNKKLLKYLLLLILAVILVFFMMKFKRRFVLTNVHGMRKYILSYGKFASMAFVLLYTIKPVVLVIPASLLSIIAGTIFNPYKATLLSMLGCFGSATVGFYISRFLGKSFVDKLLKGKAMTLDSSIEKNGFKIMFLMRLSLVFPYDPLSYAAGLSKMRYKDFILGTILGVLPEMILYSVVGENFRRPLSIKFLLPIISVVILAVGGIYIYKCLNKENNT